MKVTSSAFSFFLLTSSACHHQLLQSTTSSSTRMVAAVAFTTTAFANHNNAPSFHRHPITSSSKNRDNHHRLFASTHERNELGSIQKCIWNQSCQSNPSRCDSRHRYNTIGSLSKSKLSHMLSVRAGSSTTSLTATATTDTTTTITTTAAAPIENFRLDYRPLPYIVKDVALHFQIYDGKTIVTNTFTITKNPNNLDASDKRLILDGDDDSVTLLSISMNDKELKEGIDYVKEPNQLILLNPQDNDVITTKVSIVPEDNTQLSGLYKSSGMYCTQCEAMGFRRITYYPDRPDNMSIYKSVRIEADKNSYPILLSNGNCVESGDVVSENDTDPPRHYAVWQDPYPKPSYLFAMVAGSLGSIEDEFITKSGRRVKLVIYSEKNSVGKLQYAMESLKRSMKWDEDRFNLEYDLDIFNIVAVEDFNMGAMENKSLNVFNTALVLADTQTATDTDYERIEGVIGHEYFHNWTGNRVTCRDWFQLTLKEGLTVFRDQEFSADMNSRAVKRIEDVKSLRASQFSEDAGPMAHPIRPESYISMDNFYTSTVYSKGAEVIRMYQTILGREGFNKGMALYFQRHDGQAVTCDDFLNAMSAANDDYDLSTFARWYSTPGTPTVRYSFDDNSQDGMASITFEQTNKGDEPLHIPISVGLLEKETGKEVVPTSVLHLKEWKQTFTFHDLSGEVIPSLLREFSAPIKLISESSNEEELEETLAFLAAYDTDGFNRWESGQKLYTSFIFQTMGGTDKQSERTLQYIYDAFINTLQNSNMDYSIKAYALMLPSETTLAEELEVVDPIAIHHARNQVKKMIARQFYEALMSMYESMTSEMDQDNELKIDAYHIGKRRFRNVLLDYLCSIRETDDEQRIAAELAEKHFYNAKGMTDKMAALASLSSMTGDIGGASRDKALQQFYVDANHDALVINKWFSIQAMASLPDILERVQKLKEHPDFTLKNPNRCRSLIASFAIGNPVGFHNIDGSGYRFLAETLLELDAMNPQISSRLAASSLIKWKRYNPERGLLMKEQLQNMLSSDTKLSKDLYEIVSKGLKE